MDARMTRIGLAARPTRIAALSTGAANGRGGTGVPAIETRLMVYILSVALLVAASLAAIANQSGRLVGVHEIPAFVCDRVELVPALTADRSAGDAGRSGDAPAKPDDLSVPGSRDSICARAPGA
jgi:hypothetical protein